MEPASKKTRHAFPTYDLTIETSVGCVQTYSAYACTGSPVLRQILEKVRGASPCSVDGGRCADAACSAGH